MNPKYAELAAQRIEPEALGLTQAQAGRLNDDRLVRSLEALASERGRNLFFRLALRVIKDFEIQVPRVHFDTTTVTFFGVCSERIQCQGN